MTVLKDISNNTVTDTIRYHESNTLLSREQTHLYLLLILLPKPRL